MKASKKLLFLKKKQRKNFCLPGIAHLAVSGRGEIAKQQPAGAA
jgi:hypothetical protein